MFKSTSKLMLAAAAFGLAVAPIAAQAKTRAGDSNSVYVANAKSAPGQGKDAEGEKLGSGADLLAAILVSLWAAGIIVIVADGDDDGDRQSPGT